jgi:acyl carrier protein phosphodiesterase
LPDLVNVSQLSGLSSGILDGIECHWRIDAFTDSHPIFRRSMGRISGAYRRYAGILIDLFYDYFLARDWAAHSDVTLEHFAEDAYGCFDVLTPILPERIAVGLQQLREENVLCSYRDEAGIELALARISRRLRRPFDLTPAMEALRNHREPLGDDFQEFFPALRGHVFHTHAARV